MQTLAQLDHDHAALDATINHFDALLQRPRPRHRATALAVGPVGCACSDRWAGCSPHAGRRSGCTGLPVGLHMMTCDCALSRACLNLREVRSVGIIAAPHEW